MSNYIPGTTEASVQTDKFFYDNKIVKWFAYATMLWGIVGMLAGILAVPVCAERLDGDGCGSLARLYDSEVATCTEQQHNEVQLKTGPCVDVQNRIVASGAEVPGSFLGMDEVLIASAPQIAQWVSPAASPRPFYAAFLQSSRSHSSTQTCIQNARIVSIPTFRRGGSGRTS